MKYRESGMPEEKMWKTFFNPVEVLSKMDVNEKVHVLIDIGCGYGTFLLPASKLVQYKAIGIDIEDEMIRACLKRVKRNKLTKVKLLSGDILSEETIKFLDRYKGKIDYICLFNILHCEIPVELLTAVYNLLNQEGKIGVIHWKYENTPRGPSMEIRPTPELINQWATEVGFYLEKQVDLLPYHYGLIYHK